MCDSFQGYCGHPVLSGPTSLHHLLPEYLSLSGPNGGRVSKVSHEYDIRSELRWVRKTHDPVCLLLRLSEGRGCPSGCVYGCPGSF